MRRLKNSSGDGFLSESIILLNVEETSFHGSRKLIFKDILGRAGSSHGSRTTILIVQPMKVHRLSLVFS